MKRSMLMVGFLLFFTAISLAQCDSTSDLKDVFAALKMDEDLPFLQSAPLYVRPELDKASLAIIHDGISRKYYTRQVTRDGRIFFDTIRLTDLERRELDSLAKKRNRKWTTSNILPCRIGRDVKIYNKDPGPSGVKRTTYQIMEPIFLRNRHLALVFYKREMPYKYSEFTLLMKNASTWELWNKVIISMED